MPQMMTANQKTKRATAMLKAHAAPSLNALLPAALGIDSRRFMQIGISLLQHTPKLADCDPVSLVLGVCRAAQDGLELDGVHATLVPYGSEATYVPMYQGLVRNALRSGMVEHVNPPRAVFAGDTFSYEYGLEEKLVHVPAPDSSNQTWDSLLGCYCVVVMKGGHTAWEFVTKEYILNIKRKSKARNGPWSGDDQDKIQMALKTAVRYVMKRVPKGVEHGWVARSIERDERTEHGLDNAIDVELEPIMASMQASGDAEVPKAEQPTGLQAVTAQATHTQAKGPDNPVVEQQPDPEPTPQPEDDGGALFDDDEFPEFPKVHPALSPEVSKLEGPWEGPCDMGQRMDQSDTVWAWDPTFGTTGQWLPEDAFVARNPNHVFTRAQPAQEAAPEPAAPEAQPAASAPEAPAAPQPAAPAAPQAAATGLGDGLGWSYPSDSVTWDNHQNAPIGGNGALADKTWGSLLAEAPLSFPIKVLAELIARANDRFTSGKGMPSQRAQLAAETMKRWNQLQAQAPA